MSPLKSQDIQQADKERTAYKKIKGETWIETYMQNKNYYIVDNEGGGDCLFASIRDGLGLAGIKVTVEELREKLSNDASEEVFQEYLKMHKMVKNELYQTNQELKKYKGELNELLKRGKSTKDRDTLLKLSEQTNDIKKRYTNKELEKNTALELKREYDFMDNVDSLDKFKLKIKTCEFWGETWAISTLERIMNIKLILFSSQAFTSGDMDNVLLCGQLNDAILQSKGEFNPSHYIKSRGAFTFKELPYDIKTKVVHKCMEKNAGPFYIIPEFKAFMENLNVSIPEDDIVETIGLYDNETVFQFYNKSSNNPAPGKGVGETIRKEDRLLFSELASIPEWRRKLSNLWVQPFQLDGHTWNSVEHYYQASKFKENNPHFYATFSIDANPEGDLSKDPSMAKDAGSKDGKYKGKKIRPSEVKMDPNFESKHVEVMKKALKEKFKDPEMNKLLKATKNAKLNQYVKSSPPIVFIELMEVRKEI